MLGAGYGAANVIQSRNQLSGLCGGMRGLNVVWLDARHVSAAVKMQMNKTDENDAEGLAQIMRTGWYRSVHVKSLDAHRARALLGARAQLVGMTTRLSNIIRGVGGIWKPAANNSASSGWSCSRRSTKPRSRNGAMPPAIPTIV